MRKCWKRWRGDNREVINPDLEIPSDFNDRIKHSHGIREKSKWKGEYRNCSVPLLKSYRQIHSRKSGDSEQSGVKRLGQIASELKRNKKVLFFLAAFFCYIDGVYTIIDMATAYGTALGLDSTGLLLALLLTQIVAFPAALLFGKIWGILRNL